MRIEIKTVYTDVDEEFLEYWIQYCGHNYGIKSKDDFPGKKFSKDPYGKSYAATEIRLIGECE